MDLINNKKIMIMAFSLNGSALSNKLKSLLTEAIVDNYCFYKYASSDSISFTKAKLVLEKEFSNYDFIIFIGAVGIAVREIAPFLKNKLVDPGVIVLDERGKFAISLLSGHIGLANKVTQLIADRIGSIPVITTGTDINNRFSIDEWATLNDMKISNMNTFKEVAGVIINNEVSFKSDFKYNGNLPNGLTLETKEYGVYITYKTDNPFEHTLRLIPKVLSVGIGCKKNTSYEVIKEVVRKVFEDNNLDLNAIKSVSSIDIKKDEEGIIKFADGLNVPFMCYSKDELNALAGDFSYSEFVFKTVGVDSVCERSAKISSNGDIILKKIALNGVTLSVAVDDYIIQF